MQHPGALAGEVVAPIHDTGRGATRVMVMSTAAFTAMFAVWLMFGILGPSIQKAVAAGIPVISMNSGSDVSKKLGALLHVGQDEFDAGKAVRRLLAHYEALSSGGTVGVNSRAPGGGT